MGSTERIQVAVYFRAHGNSYLFCYAGNEEEQPYVPTIRSDWMKQSKASVTLGTTRTPTCCQNVKLLCHGWVSVLKQPTRNFGIRKIYKPMLLVHFVSR